MDERDRAASAWFSRGLVQRRLAKADACRREVKR